MTDTPTLEDVLERQADLEQRIIFLESEIDRLDADTDALVRKLRQTQNDAKLR